MLSIARVIRQVVYGRNIANQDVINKWLKTLKKETDKPQIHKWLKANLRNYILNKYGMVTRVRVAKLKDPDWLKEAIDRGEEVFNVKLGRPFENEIKHVLDYFKSLGDHELNKLSKISVDDALKKAEDWTKALTKKATLDEGPEDVEIVRTYKDGFNWKRLLTAQALNREGRLMKHCVGSYAKDVKTNKTRIYSLRDPENKPHLTVEMNPKLTKVLQMKGFANKSIKPVYTQYAKDFIKKPIKGIKLKKIEDLLNIGILEVEGKWYNVYELPDGLTLPRSVNLEGSEITKLPKDLTVGGNLYLTGTKITELPEGLTVGGNLWLQGSRVTKLPEDLKVGGSLYLQGTDITALPGGLKVGGSLDLRDTEITELPADLKVGGSLWLQGTEITALPEGLKVGEGLYLQGTEITELPKGLKIKGSLWLQGSKIMKLPEGFTVGGGLYLQGSRVTKLPEGLTVGRDLDLKGTGITKIPKSAKISGRVIKE